MRTRSADQTRRLAAASRPCSIRVTSSCSPAGSAPARRRSSRGSPRSTSRMPVVSPTFTLAREYTGRLRLVHVDVYRLESRARALRPGPRRPRRRRGLAVEWGDVVRDYLGPDHLEVCLTAGADGPDDRLVAFHAAGRLAATAGGARRARRGGLMLLPRSTHRDPQVSVRARRGRAVRGEVRLAEGAGTPSSSRPPSRISASRPACASRPSTRSPSGSDRGSSRGCASASRP